MVIGASPERILDFGRRVLRLSMGLDFSEEEEGR